MTDAQFPIFTVWKGVDVAIVTRDMYHAFIAARHLPDIHPDLEKMIFKRHLGEALRNMAGLQGRRTTIEIDRELSEALAQSLQTMTISEAHAQAVKTYGSDRVPSRSAVARFWLRLRRAWPK